MPASYQPPDRVSLLTIHVKDKNIGTELAASQSILQNIKREREREREKRTQDSIFMTEEGTFKMRVKIDVLAAPPPLSQTVEPPRATILSGVYFKTFDRQVCGKRT
jgi:hypothetical protein